MVLDLDETLVHSINGSMEKPDLQFVLKQENRNMNISMKKRPFVKEFLGLMTKYYEVVVFTASVQSVSKISLSQYANPIMRELDTRGWIDHRLYREDCRSLGGTFVKDLDTLGRDLKNVIILDVSNK